MATVNEQLQDSAITQGISIQRVAKDLRNKVLNLLDQLKDDLTGKLSSGAIKTEWQQARAKSLIAFAQDTIDKAYKQIGETALKDLDGLSQAEIMKLTKAVDTAVGAEISTRISPAMLEAIAQTEKTLVQGATQSSWWEQQSANLQQDFAANIQKGMLAGKSIDSMARVVSDTMDKPRAQAETLVRTAVASVQSEAQKTYYSNNEDIIKGIKWVSTLDGRTTPICIALSDMAWSYPDFKPIGHDQPWPGYPPVHWNCRSTTMPVLKSWQELAHVELPSLNQQTLAENFTNNLLAQGFSEEEAANIAMDTQASMDGQVPAGLNYEDWLKSKPEAFQQQVLGVPRWQLWNDGKINLSQLIDGNGKPLTVSELKAAAEANVAVPAAAKAEGEGGLSLAERNILQAQLTDGLQNSQYHSTWLSAESGQTVDQAFTHSISQNELSSLHGQKQLWNLSNAINKAEMWDPAEMKVWAQVDDLANTNFAGAKIVGPTGRVITLKLKKGESWLMSDVKVFEDTLKTELAKKGEKGFSVDKAYRQAIKATGKLTYSTTPMGEVTMDEKAFKAVYPPTKAKPIPYVTPKVKVAEKPIPAPAPIAPPPAVQTKESVLSNVQAATKKVAGAVEVDTSTGTVTAAKDLKLQTPTDFPADPISLKKIRSLGGSTGAELVQDADGNLFVRKKGASAGQIEQEALANHLYQIAGVNVPETRLYATKAGPVQLTRMIENAVTLGDYLADASPAEALRVKLELQHGFATDALLANWDVVGLDKDNILVDQTGKLWRIDNGGSLQYRAMGTKKPFGKEVTELQTLLDPKVNPQTAEIFKGITHEEIVTQINQLEKVKDELISATPEGSLRTAMRDRLQYVSDWANPVKTEVGLGTWASEPETVAGINNSRVNGLSVLSDKGDVEDAQVLVWTEKNKAGQVETVAQFKLTEPAQAKLEELLKPYMPSGAAPLPAAVKSMSQDVFYDDILVAAKNINYHITNGDTNFATAKIQNALKHESALTAYIQHGTEVEQEMAQHYTQVLSKIEQAVEKAKAGETVAKIPDLSRFEPPKAEIGKPVMPGNPWNVQAEPLSFQKKTLQDGHATNTDAVAWDWYGRPGARVRLAGQIEDVRFSYIPHVDANDTAWAFHGTVELRTAGEASPTVLAKMQGTAATLGTDLTPPSEEYQKALYLTKNIYLQNKSKLPVAVERVMADQTISDVERLKKITNAAQTYGIELKGDLWKGEVDAFGNGYRYYYRADMPVEQLRSEMKDYVIHHDLGGSATISQKVDQFLNSGGQITPTVQRVRKGIPIVEGQSPEADMKTGGANYFFTRIRERSYVPQGFVFDIENLARTDVWSFPSDVYGDVRGTRRNKRGITISEFKQFAGNGGNETDFKNGLNLLDDIKYITVNSAQERDNVIKVFKKHKINAFPDGRKLEDVVVISGNLTRLK